MSVFPGSPRINKAGFLLLDERTEQPKVIVFQYNPETLIRKLDSRSVATGGVGGQSGEFLATPREEISFTMVLDATDKLETGDPVTSRLGMYPLLSAIELLTYPPATSAGTLVLFVWGPQRILPVRIVQLQVVEQLFDPLLNPIQAEIMVTLLTLNSDDLTNDLQARELWRQHLLQIEQMAQQAYSASLAPLGIGGLP